MNKSEEATLKDVREKLSKIFPTLRFYWRCASCNKEIYPVLKTAYAACSNKCRIGLAGFAGQRNQIALGAISKSKLRKMMKLREEIQAAQSLLCNLRAEVRNTGATR